MKRYHDHEGDVIGCLRRGMIKDQEAGTTGVRVKAIRRFDSTIQVVDSSRWSFQEPPFKRCREGDRDQRKSSQSEVIGTIQRFASQIFACSCVSDGFRGSNHRLSSNIPVVRLRACLENSQPSYDQQQFTPQSRDSSPSTIKNVFAKFGPIVMGVPLNWTGLGIRPRHRCWIGAERASVGYRTLDTNR